jgi:hypothetical protein
LNLSQVPVAPQTRSLPELNFEGSAPVRANTPQIPDQPSAPAVQLAFELVLHAPAADDSTRSNPSLSDATDSPEDPAAEQAAATAAAELRTAAVPSTKAGGHIAPVTIEPASGPISERRNDADPDGGSASPRVSTSPARIEPPVPAFSLQPAQGGTPAHDPPAPAEKADAAPPAPPEQALPAAQRPVQNLQIRLGDGSPEAVQVQISQQAGNIHVSVRSADPALTLPLRQNLPGLVENLEKQGYHAEPVSLHEPAAVSVLHSEVKSQTDQNQSWYGSDHGGRRDGAGEAKGRKKRAAGADFRVPLNQTQETDA